MADDMKLEIQLEAVDDSAKAFNDLESSLSQVDELAQELTKVFADFSSTVLKAMDEASKAIQQLTNPIQDTAREVATAFEEPSRQAAEQLRQISEGLSGIDQEATTVADGVFQQFDKAAKDSEESLKVISEGFKTTETAAVEAGNAVVKEFEDAAKKSEEAIAKVGNHGANGGNGDNHGGLFGIQGQMDTMYGGMSLGAVSAPIDLGLGEAVKQFADFDQSMRLVNQELGVGEDGFKSLEKSIVDMSNETGISADQLAKGLYNVVATGVTDSSKALDMLKVAADGAKAGNTDLDTSTRALNAVMGAYGLSADQASHIMDVMFTAVNNGQMHFTDLAKSVGASATSASSAGVSYEELAAAQATLTNVGKNAESASQNLNSLITGIIAPTGQASKEAKKLGIEWDAQALKAHGLSGMINEAIKATGGNNEELKKLVPNQRAYMAVLALGENANKQYTDTLKQMQEAHGATAKALEEYDKGAGDEIEKMKTSITNAGIALATALAPAITAVTEAISGLAHWFQSLTPSTQEFLGIALGLTAAITGLGAGFFFFLSGIGGLVSGFNAIKEAFVGISVAEGIMDALNPVGWIVLAGAAVIALAAAIIAYWDPIKDFVVKLWDDIKSGTESAWNAITTWLTTTWSSIVNEAINIWNTFKTSISNLWNEVVTGIQNLWNQFKSWITNTTTTIVNGVVDSFKWLYDHNYYFKDLVDFIKNAWETLKQDAEIIWKAIEDYFSTTWNNIKTQSDTIWQAIQTGLSAVWNAIVKLADTVWTPIETFFSDIWTSVSSTADSEWGSISGSLEQWWSGAVNQAQQIWDGLKTYFEGLWNDAYNWGSTLISKFIDGVKSMVSSLMSELSSIGSSIMSALGFHDLGSNGEHGDSQWTSELSGDSNGSSSAGADGSHASGLWRVPFDGYRSILHQDEMVLTASQANQVRQGGFASSPIIPMSGSGGFGGGGSNVYITVQANGNITRNEQELGNIVSRAIWNKMKQQGKFST